MNFVAIDFETARKQKDSACEIGLVEVANGCIVEATMKEIRIRPPTPYFNRECIQEHGITWDDVKNEPTFGEIWPKIQPLLEGKVLIAHNADFDIGVLRESLAAYGIPCPNLCYACTKEMAKQQWPQLSNYRLETVAEHLGIAFKHHRAGQDALCCAKIALEILQRTSKSFEDFPGVLKTTRAGERSVSQDGCGERKKRTDPSGSKVAHVEKSPDVESIDKSNPFYGKNVVFTGTLKFIDRDEAAQKVKDLGGFPKDSVSGKTHFLVIGDSPHETKMKTAEEHKTPRISGHEFREMLELPSCRIVRKTPEGS